MKRVISTDPLTGITTYWIVDPQTGAVTIQSEQKAEAVLEANKRSYAGINAKERHGDMSRVASIPLNVYYDLKRKGIVDDPVAFKRWLNDSENRVFRTRGGTV